MLPINRVSELLGLLEEQKRISFDMNYAEEVYLKYNEGVAFEDDECICKLMEIFRDKKILLIAPGRQTKLHKEHVAEMIKSGEYIVIGLNYDMNMDVDYIMTTRIESYFNYVNENKTIIVPSNITKIAGKI